MPEQTVPVTDGQPCPQQLAGISYRPMTLTDGTKLEYGVALPTTFDCHQSYPILLALPPGGQDHDMVRVGLEEYWAPEGNKRGWIILSPVAPEGKLFFNGSERLIPEFLQRTAEQFHPEGGKYHLAGISNGGISAFRILVSYPDLFAALIPVPGFPQGDDAAKLNTLKPIPVIMAVGELDTAWRNAMQETKAQLESLGWPLSLTVVPGDDHILRHLDTVKLWAQIDSFRAPRRQ